MKRLLAMLVIISAVPAHAVTYKWVDKKGTVSFTEDLGKVPPEYRKKVVILDADVPTGPEITEIDESKGKPDATGAESAKDRTTAGDKKAILFGGKDENVWRKDFGRLKSDLRAAEDQAEQLRGRLADTSKMSRTEYLSIQASLKNVELRVQELKTKLSALEETANKAGVPAGARE
ncbi:DUF4124 domain-containing protein [Geomobilimonas luticola]|uniref:DUF1552 domain-containing protein n=1 Tax=Geomobilimonas luticola TaxID=1114878 RepID=A0ABS5SG65_9BACT|nr:DUF4124 domain-containing protein [Geomobilimonas luticola]MBT0654352.1 DUF1552 domain-containing protein [Geomobilimonas luticola]